MKIKNKPGLKAEIVYYSLMAFLSMSVFKLAYDYDSVLPSYISYLSNKTIVSLIIVSLFVTAFYIALNKKKETKLSLSLLKELIGLITGALIGITLFIIAYSFYYLFLSRYHEYSYRIELYVVLFSLLFLFILSIIFSVLHYLLSKEEKIKRYAWIIYIAFAVSMLFLFLFTENDAVFILFYFALTVSGSFLVYFIIKYISHAFKGKWSIPLRLSSMHPSMRSILLYVTGSMALIFLFFLMSESANRYADNKEIRRYEYEIDNPSDELLDYLADSPLYKYNILKDEYELNYLGYKFHVYALDMEDAQSFYDYEYESKLNYIPTNAITIPYELKYELELSLGERIKVEYDGGDVYYTLYGFIKSGNDFIIYSGQAMNENGKKVLLNTLSENGLNDIKNTFNVNISKRDGTKNIIERIFDYGYVLDIITLTVSLICLMALYFLLRGPEDHKLYEDLSNAGIKRKEIYHTELNKEYLEMFLSLFFVFVFYLLLYLIYKDKITEIFNNYKLISFANYLLIIFEIFIFYNIMVIGSSLLGRKKYGKEEEKEKN